MRMLKACATAPGVARVLVPGELEYRLESHNRNLGIPVAEEVVAQLVAFGSEAGIDFPPSREDQTLGG